MSNLESFSNIYASLAESAYNNRPNPFPNYQNMKTEREFDFSKDKKINGELTKGGQNLPNNGKFYLQPDNTVKTIEELGTIRVPKVNGGYESQSYVKNTYQKGLLTDEKAGFNAYYVTDTPTLSKDTKHTYFVTRGSDGISLNNLNLNDWWDNNQAFTTRKAYIPQAKLATKAMHQKIAEMADQAPNATMAVTGHSLGTMVSIQAVANLPEKDISKIDKVVLFQGPDARESISKMSEQAQKNIQTLEEQGKIEYYVNAFDVVSMLNRNKKGVDEIGKVHYLLPKSFNTTFDMSDKNGSSHDFGQYQLNPDGTPKEANLKEHGYIFTSGIKLSKLIDDVLEEAVKMVPQAGVTASALLSVIASGGVNPINNIMTLFNGKITYDQAKKLYDKVMDGYSSIVAEAKAASEWQGKVASLQKSISNASGSKKIKLRGDLANAVAQKAKSVGEEYETILKNVQQEYKDEVDAVSKEILNGANEIRQYLSYFEMQEMISPYEKSRLWDSGQATSNTNQVKQYKEKMAAFNDKLTTVAKNIQEYDGQAGSHLFKK